MRSDMKHVLIDRPRTGGWANGRNHGRADEGKGYWKEHQKLARVNEDGDDNLSKFESSSRNRRYWGRNKELSDHLGPLRRFLWSNVGRPWNDVYSEICKHIRLDSTLQRHIREHVDSYVEKDVKIIDGKLYHNHGYELSYSYRDRGQLYVHPETGLLCLYKPKPFNYESKKNYVEGPDKDTQYHCVNGAWWEVKLGPTNDFWHWRGDSFLVMIYRMEKKRVPIAGTPENSSARNKLYGRYNVYCVSKRQLNSREIKRLGLREALASSFATALDKSAA